MDELTYGLLNLIKSRNSLCLNEIAAILNCNIFVLAEPVSYLLNNKYICYVIGIDKVDESCLSPKTRLRITYEGELAMLQYKTAKRNFKYSEFRAWFTLAIALIALVLSLIDMFLLH